MLIAKRRSVTFKLGESDYEHLRELADEGAISLSGAVRNLIAESCTRRAGQKAEARHAKKAQR